MNGHRAKAIRKEAKNSKYYTKPLVTKNAVVRVLKDIYYGKYGNHTFDDIK